MVTKKSSKRSSRTNYKPKTSEKEWPIRSINPMIGTTPKETLDNVVGALCWLQSADMKIHEALGGIPNDQVAFGRYLLGNCCHDALRFAGAELAAKKEAA